MYDKSWCALDVKAARTGFNSQRAHSFFFLLAVLFLP